VRDRGIGRKTSKESLCSPYERRNVVMQREEKGRDIATHRLIERRGELWEVPEHPWQREIYCRSPKTLLYLSRFYLARSEMQTHLRCGIYSHSSRRGFEHRSQDKTSHIPPGLACFSCKDQLIFRLCSMISERRIKEPAQNMGRHRLPHSETGFSAAGTRLFNYLDQARHTVS
jgi:hypothetical protein